jgi:hypothetical protein
LGVLSNCFLIHSLPGKLASYILMQVIWHHRPAGRYTKESDGEPVPDHQRKLTYSVALEKTRIADLFNQLRMDPERFVDLVRFTNLQNYHTSARMDFPPNSK